MKRTPLPLPPRTQPLKRSRIKKKSKRMKLVLEADVLVRTRIFERDGNKCVRCPHTEYLTPSHVYPKGRYQNLRWLEINILTLCMGCHLQWWHLNPVEAAEWFQKTYPDRYAELRMLKDTMEKPDLKELISQLKGATQ